MRHRALRRPALFNAMTTASDARFSDARFSDARFQEICEAIEHQARRLSIPGVAVGLWHAGREYQFGFGVTSVEHPLPVTPDTLFQIGSITKTFLATAVMRLVEAGRLDLDAPLRTYLPNLRLADEATATRVTMRHLLTHTGGWVGDYFNDFGFGDEALAKMVAQMSALPQLTPLGEVYSYNNSGFYLAGRVIEVITGQAFELALSDLLLKPLGLGHSFFFPHEVMTHRFVVGHRVVNHQAQVARPWAVGRVIHPAGGLVSTVGDLLRYARLHLGSEPRLLSAESLSLMHTPLFPSTGPSHVGLSWSITPIDGLTLLRHGGATKGQTADLRIVPQAQFAMATLTNSDEGATLYGLVSGLALKRFLDFSTTAPTPRAMTGSQLVPYIGRYHSVGGICEVSVNDNQLSLQMIDKGGFPTPETPPDPEPIPPTRLQFYADDRVIALDEPFKDAYGEFLRDPAGQITWLRFGGRVRARETP